MTTRKLQSFNMIEVLLALAVIAFGMTSILGLFPVGLNASRNAIAQNMSADVADQMITYLRIMSEINQTQYARMLYNADSLSDSTNVETQIISGRNEFTYNNTDNDKEQEIDILSTAFLRAYSSQRIESDNRLEAGTIDFDRVASRWAVFNVHDINNRPRLFFIVQGPNCTENDVVSNPKIPRPVDYSAMAKIWKSPVQIRRWDGASSWSLWSPGYDISGKINIELSWPLELPYNERKKRYYQIVITNPNP